MEKSPSFLIARIVLGFIACASVFLPWGVMGNFTVEEMTSDDEEKIITAPLKDGLETSLVVRPRSYNPNRPNLLIPNWILLIPACLIILFSFLELMEVITVWYWLQFVFSGYGVLHCLGFCQNYHTVKLGIGPFVAIAAFAGLIFIFQRKAKKRV